MCDIKARFGTVMKISRVEKGITQEFLAEKTGLHRTYISEVERGIRNISLENIYKITIALDQNLEEFFAKIEKEKN